MAVPVVPLVVIGPSAAGKSTVVRALARRGLVEVTPTWTTRPRRADERAGSVEHRFVDDATFAACERAGLFLDVVRPFGLAYRYGLAVPHPPPPGVVPVVMVRAAFVGRVARLFPEHLCYQIEDSLERARERLLARGAALGTRLDGYEDERVAGRALAGWVFVNAGPVGPLVDAVAAALAADFPRNDTDNNVLVTLEGAMAPQG